jgi:hypothetical protein
MSETPTRRIERRRFLRAAGLLPLAAEAKRGSISCSSWADP